TIQASEIVARIAEETVAALRAVHASFEVAPSAAEHPASAVAGDKLEIAAGHTGYIQDVDVVGLYRFACRRGVTVEVRRAVGDFVIAGRPLLAISPAADLKMADRKLLGRAFGIQNYRTIEQDPEFGLRQIVDIALKALSPGINDSTTAVHCVDYLEVILHVAIRCPAVPEQQWEGDRLRITMKQPGTSRLLNVALNEIRQNARTNVAVILRLLKLVRELAEEAQDDALRTELRRHAELIVASARLSIPLADDREEVERRAAEIHRLATPRLDAVR
ncbi:MAG TPA: DUF2254 family protein, partial [Candidatus Synoicihabitans sp.]|nr:DUF2254 family protein [Candidatus Synoicihabitans sp.]